MFYLVVKNGPDSASETYHMSLSTTVSNITALSLLISDSRIILSRDN